ncbi:unnamed protein product [Caenorhabditis angaria]|uniref:Uncharacterized protein n=1 Tax=Caenorhabditis angaria TaxID=860376 RepID=A0A9P1IQE4_9PELO|nr:unnamed protein product [Caenorhabditis angaria]
MLVVVLLFIFSGITLQNVTAPPHNIVDHIEDIEVEATQIIITTSKDGRTPEHLKIHIELIDIEENKKVNPVDLSGGWLLLTRGRYTIPFLRPGALYGVRFKSENEINGQKVYHEDERVVRTKSRENHPYGSLAGAIAPLVGIPGIPSITPVAPSEKQDHKEEEEFVDALSVKMHRSLDGIENYESLYVTVSWKDHKGRNNNTSGVVKIRVICENTDTKEEIHLKGDEDAVTIEITMDQKYDIEEMDRVKHQIKAHITPLKCHKICWTSDLVLASGFGDFTKHLGETCEDIEGTTSTTYLRNLKRISVEENNLSINELIVETEVVESDHAVVTINLERLGENDTQSLRKTFDTSTSNGKFIVPLEDDSIYAVRYEYLKTKPFHYTSKSQFLIESPSANSTRASASLVDISVIPTTFDYKKDKPESALKPEPPYLILTRSKVYGSHDLVLHMDPFCGENRTNVRLEDRYPVHQIDATPILCGFEPKMYFCNHNATYKKCDSTLCFSTSVILQGETYDSETRCLNFTSHFPPLISTSRFAVFFYFP